MPREALRRRTLSRSATYSLTQRQNTLYCDVEMKHKEDRAFIKINGDTSLFHSKDMCTSLANMARHGSPEWNILPMTLPVTFGRYHNSIAKAFQTMQDKPSKYTYMYGRGDKTFEDRQKSIATSYKTIQIDSQSNIVIPPVN